MLLLYLFSILLPSSSEHIHLVEVPPSALPRKLVRGLRWLCSLQGLKKDEHCQAGLFNPPPLEDGMMDLRSKWLGVETPDDLKNMTVGSFRETRSDYFRCCLLLTVEEEYMVKILERIPLSEGEVLEVEKSQKEDLSPGTEEKILEGLGVERKMAPLPVSSDSPSHLVPPPSIESSASASEASTPLHLTVIAGSSERGEFPVDRVSNILAPQIGGVWTRTNRNRKSPLRFVDIGPSLSSPLCSLLGRAWEGLTVEPVPWLADASPCNVVVRRMIVPDSWQGVVAPLHMVQSHLLPPSSPLLDLNTASDVVRALHTSYVIRETDGQLTSSQVFESRDVPVLNYREMVRTYMAEQVPSFLRINVEGLEHGVLEQVLDEAGSPPVFLAVDHELSELPSVLGMWRLLEEAGYTDCLLGLKDILCRLGEEEGEPPLTLSDLLLLGEAPAVAPPSGTSSLQHALLSSSKDDLKFLKGLLESRKQEWGPVETVTALHRLASLPPSRSPPSISQNLFPSVAGPLVAHVSSLPLDGRQCGNLGWALGKLESREGGAGGKGRGPAIAESALRAAWKRIEDGQVRHANPQALSNIVYGLGLTGKPYIQKNTLSTVTQTFFETLNGKKSLKTATSSHDGFGLSSQSVSNFAWGLGKLRELPEYQEEADLAIHQLALAFGEEGQGWSLSSFSLEQVCSLASSFSLPRTDALPLGGFLRFLLEYLEKSEGALTDQERSEIGQKGGKVVDSPPKKIRQNLNLTPRAIASLSASLSSIWGRKIKDLDEEKKVFAACNSILNILIRRGEVMGDTFTGRDSAEFLRSLSALNSKHDKFFSSDTLERMHKKCFLGLEKSPLAELHPTSFSSFLWSLHKSGLGVKPEGERYRRWGKKVILNEEFWGDKRGNSGAMARNPQVFSNKEGRVSIRNLSSIIWAVSFWGDTFVMRTLVEKLQLLKSSDLLKSEFFKMNSADAANILFGIANSGGAADEIFSSVFRHSSSFSFPLLPSQVCALSWAAALTISPQNSQEWRRGVTLLLEGGSGGGAPPSFSSFSMDELAQLSWSLSILGLTPYVEDLALEIWRRISTSPLSSPPPPPPPSGKYPGSTGAPAAFPLLESIEEAGKTQLLVALSGLHVEREAHRSSNCGRAENDLASLLPLLAREVSARARPASPHSSAFHHEVLSCLQKTFLEWTIVPEKSFVASISGGENFYSFLIDVVVQKNGKKGDKSSKKEFLALELDGHDKHFVFDYVNGERREGGKGGWKKKILKKLGVEMKVIQEEEWKKVRADPEARREFLEKILNREQEV